MILNKLTLKNYKKYKDESIEFYDGMTGILGQNGVGKTSLVEAILFALYGIRNTGLNNDFINSAESNDYAHVILEFSIGKDVYTIERKFKRGKRNSHKAKLFRNGNLYVDSSSEIELELEKLVGMNVSDFKNSVYSGQKEMMNIIEYTPAERLKWFMQMFNITFLKKEAEEELGKREKEVDTELLKYNVLSDTADIDTLNWKKAEYEQHVKDNDIEIEKYKKSVDEYDVKVTESYNSVTKLRNLASEAKEIENDIKNIDNNLSISEASVAGLDVKFSEINKANEDIKEYGDIETEFGKAIDKHEWSSDRYNNYLKNVDKCCSIGENIASNYKFHCRIFILTYMLGI